VDGIGSGLGLVTGYVISNIEHTGFCTAVLTVSYRVTHKDKRL
jgi:hypothetical protein